MKYKKIMLFFCVAIPLCIALRFMELQYIVEAKTGFYKSEFTGYGNAIIAVIFAFAVMTAVFSFTSHRSPEHPPKPNIPLSICSFILAISIVAEMFLESFAPDIIIWQVVFLRISEILAAAFLVLFGLNKFINIPIHQVIYAFFPIYIIFKIIFSFTAISSLALISDNILLIASYCTSLLFAVSFAKLYNKMDTEKGFKRLLASGLVSVILCFTQSIPHIIYNLLNNNVYLHTSMHTNINLLFLGIFILTFLLSHFSKENACE